MQLQKVLQYLNENKAVQLKQNRGFHASHAAYEMLNEANDKFALDYPGIEGWSLNCGEKGVNYLNPGDPYVETIFALADFSSIEFKISTVEEIMNSDWFLSLD